MEPHKEYNHRHNLRPKTKQLHEEHAQKGKETEEQRFSAAQAFGGYPYRFFHPQHQEKKKTEKHKTSNNENMKDNKSTCGLMVFSKIKPLSVHYGLFEEAKTIFPQETRNDTDSDAAAQSAGTSSKQKKQQHIRRVLEDLDFRIIVLEFSSFYLLYVSEPHGTKDAKYRHTFWTPVFRKQLSILCAIKPTIWSGTLYSPYGDNDIARLNEATHQGPGISTSHSNYLPLAPMMLTQQLGHMSSEQQQQRHLSSPPRMSVTTTSTSTVDMEEKAKKKAVPGWISSYNVLTEFKEAMKQNELSDPFRSIYPTSTGATALLRGDQEWTTLYYTTVRYPRFRDVCVLSLFGMCFMMK